MLRERCSEVKSRSDTERKDLPEDTIRLTFKGSAGQSFGAYHSERITLRLVGDSNDFVGKGLSGGKIIVHPDPTATFIPERNTIVGNVSFYGASQVEKLIFMVWQENVSVSVTVEPM